MIHPYEIISKSALPAFRAMISKRLRESYSMTQQDVARRLGVTQASVSNYSRKVRGVMLNLETDPSVAKAADQVALVLSSDRPDQREALRLMTEVCDYLRYSHLLCALHADLESFPVEGCSACDGAHLAGDRVVRLKAASG